jgi:cytochrome P450
MAPAFANNHIKRMDQVTVQKTEEWIHTRLDGMVNNDETIDINKEMVDLTLNVILEAAFEYNMPPKEKLELMECLHVTLSTFVFPNPFKMTFWFLFPSIWKAHSKARQLMSIARNIILSYRSKDPSRITKGTVIDLIINNPNYNDDDERAADIIDLIVAGHETSSSSMTFLLLELAKNQHEQQKLQRVLRSLPDQQERTDSDYLKQCIKEGMRVWPVAAVGPMRYVGRDFIIPAGEDDDNDDHSNKDNDNISSEAQKEDFFIPKGSIVFMPAIAVLHNPKYFDRPLEFDPSRWQNPSDTMKRAFLPFSLGKRNCLGQSLANSEMQSILSRLCTHYNFELVDEGTVGMFITLKPIGVRLKATRIEGDLF